MQRISRSLERGTLVLRPLSLGDVEEYVRLGNEPSIGPRINHPQPYLPRHFYQLLAQMGKNPQHYVWMIEAEELLAGVINAAPLREKTIFQGGYWLDPEFRGKGIAARALGMVRDFVMQELQAVRIQAVVEPDNAASIAVLEKCGYRHEGCLRKFYPTRTRGLVDVHMYAIVNEENP